MYYVVVAGGRQFNDYEMLNQYLASIVSTLVSEGIGEEEICFVSAACEGADEMAGEWAITNGYMHLCMPIIWEKYGDEAWRVTNKNMADLGNELIVFWNGVSEGTRDMINQAVDRKLNVMVAQYE